MKKRSFAVGMQSWEQNVKLVEQKLEYAKSKRTEIDSLDLFELNTGESTHPIGSKGFRNGVTKNAIKGWKLEFRRGRMDFLSKSETGAGIKPEDWENKVKGKTLIYSNVSKNMDEETKTLEKEVLHVWNNVISDKDRSTVDVLRINFTEEARYKKTGKGEKIRTLGTHGERKVFGGLMISPSVLTVHVASEDEPNDVLNTVIHELAHAKWATQVATNKEKMNKFVDKIISKGREESLTEYSKSYFDDLDELDSTHEKEIRRIEKRFGDSEEQKGPKEFFINKTIEDHKENVEKARILIGNETHSEYFAMVGSPTNRSYHTVDKVKLKEMSKMIKEGLYD